MNKKGFTLVELIGVILILGIVVTLVSFSITSIISENKKKSLKLTTDEYIKLADNYAVENGIMGSYECDINGNSMTCTSGTNTENIATKTDGYTGYIKFNPNDLSYVCVSNDQYVATGYINNYSVVSLTSSNTCNAG